MKFIPTEVLSEIAHQTCAAYEMCCSWAGARRAAIDEFRERFGFQPSAGQIGTVMNMAKAEWSEIVLDVKRKIAAGE